MTDTTAFETWHKQYNADHPVVTAEELVFAAFQAGAAYATPTNCPKLAGLKPCPFCGRTAEIEHLEGGRWSVGCMEHVSETCMGYQSLTSFATKREAIAAWNTRAADAIERLSPAVGVPREPTEAMIEAGEEFMSEFGVVQPPCRIAPIWRAMWDAATPTDAGEQGVTQADAIEALVLALEPFNLLATGVNMNDPLSKWFTMAQFQAARDAILAATRESDHG